MAANRSALSSRGTPAAGSSSSSTLRLGRQRQRDLEQPLLAVGQLARQPVAVRAERQRLQDAVGLLDRLADSRAAAARNCPATPRRSQTASVTASSAVEMREQRVDLERAHQAARLTR